MAVRPNLGEVLHELARQKECRIEEGHLREDPVHMLISIPPQLAVSSVIGFIKGKSAIYIARNFSGRRRNFTGENFWARGFYVTTVGLDEDSVRDYIKHQEKEDQRVDQFQTALSGSRYFKPPALSGVHDFLERSEQPIKIIHLEQSVWPWQAAKRLLPSR